MINLDQFDIIVNIVLSVTIITGNSLAILAAWLCRRQKSVTSKILMLSLSFTDLLAGIACTFDLIVVDYELFRCDDYIDLLRFFLTFCIYPSNLFGILAIAVHQYIVIAYPLLYKKYMSKKIILSIVILNWSSSFFISILFTYFVGFKEDENWGYFSSNILYWFYFIVWAVTVILYIRIWMNTRAYTQRLKTRAKAIGLENKNFNNKKSNQKYLESTAKLENESGSVTEVDHDSSYDSDYEAEVDSITRSHINRNNNQHANVTCATSDTLATEFTECVTVQHQQTNATGTSTSATTACTLGYAARVEFALKLGYTERLVQTVLHKLGPEPGQNDLLAELIKLGSSGVVVPEDNNNKSPVDNYRDFSNDSKRGENTIIGYPNDGSYNVCYGNCVTPPDDGSSLRPVVIDGSNVAMSHGNKEIFSCRGIKVCVEWFRARGHREITVFVPKWRKETSRPDSPIADQKILIELERDRLLVFTPSRLVGGKRMICYDDRYILRLAAELDGIVVSNDNYRDLAQESPEFRRVVEKRILMYSFVNDRFMPPDDPLGRSGPTLENFLRVTPQRVEPAPPCPYAKKCTYGNKCKFRHPERGPHPHKSVTERLMEHAQRQLLARSSSLTLSGGNRTSKKQHPVLTKTKSWTSGSDNSSLSLPVVTTNSQKKVENVIVDESHRIGASQVYSSHLAAHQSSSQGYPSSSLGWATPKIPNSKPELANTCRKLQRQLSFNPSCDSRIVELQKYYQQQQQSSSPQHDNNSSQNRQLTRHASNEAYPVSSNISISWNQHQQLYCQQIIHQRHHQVTRNTLGRGTTAIAVPAVQYSSSQRLGNSEPQLNLLGTGAQDNARRGHLRYHLASIFPDEQVQAAMAMYPRETDPQRICAAILAMNS